jgi:hypothetical protein
MNLPEAKVRFAIKRGVGAVLVGIASVLFQTGDVAANDQIVAEFGSKIAQAMCADGGAWLEAYNTPRERCPQISQSVLGPCMKKVLNGRSIPLKTEGELQQVSQELYACMKDSFLATYGGATKS